MDLDFEWVQESNLFLYYAVRAENEFGVSETSDLLVFATAPKSFAASAGTSTEHVVVQWSSAPCVSEYRVSRVNRDGTIHDFGATQATSVIDSGIRPGTYHEYRCHAVGLDGSVSAIASAFGYRGLVAPTGVEASNDEDDRYMVLHWSPVSGAMGYEVSRAYGADAPLIVGSGVGVPFKDTSGAVGLYYTYRIRALGSDPFVSGEWSAPVLGRRCMSDPPYTITASAGSFIDRIEVMWSPVEGAQGYEVFLSPGPVGGDWTSLGVTDQHVYVDRRSARDSLTPTRSGHCPLRDARTSRLAGQRLVMRVWRRHRRFRLAMDQVHLM
jgi:hypothetical protein